MDSTVGTEGGAGRRSRKRGEEDAAGQPVGPVALEEGAGGLADRIGAGQGGPASGVDGDAAVHMLVVDREFERFGGDVDLVAAGRPLPRAAEGVRAEGGQTAAGSGAAETRDHLRGEGGRAHAAVRVAAGPDAGFEPLDADRVGAAEDVADVEARSPDVGEAAGDGDAIAIGAGRAEIGAGRHHRPAEDAEGGDRPGARPAGGGDELRCGIVEEGEVAGDSAMSRPKARDGRPCRASVGRDEVMRMTRGEPESEAESSDGA